MEGFNKDYEKVIREGIIMEYSCGRTASLSELYTNYPSEYRQMKQELIRKSTEELNIARKRLIAVLFSFLKDNKEKPTMQYVKSVACHAAKVTNFNNIPLNKLKALYRTFGTKNTKEWTELKRGLIWPALRKENQN
ncbi:MAG TPA: hypothetical protein DEG28_06605 [Porphyromonadaceae bacterium]|nr:hypothetical protein [Porphyromonadaceae bacterium]